MKKKSRYVNNPLNSAKVSFLRRTTFTPGETLFTPWSMLEDFKGGFGRQRWRQRVVEGVKGCMRGSREWSQVEWACGGRWNARIR